MNFHERKGREKTDHRSWEYVYIGAKRFSKSTEEGRKLTSKILSLAGATSYRATKGVDEGRRAQEVGVSAFYRGGIFTEWEHELAANGMNVWWSESDRSEVAASPLFPILAVITSLVDQIKGSPRWKPVEREKDRANKWLTGKRWIRNDGLNPWFTAVPLFSTVENSIVSISNCFFFFFFLLVAFESNKEGEEKRRKKKKTSVNANTVIIAMKIHSAFRFLP